VTWFQNSAEHEVLYARAHAMITDVIEASLEVGWKGWTVGKLFPTSMRHRLLILSMRRLIRWNSRSGGGECGDLITQASAGGSQVTTMNRRPLEMRPDNAVQRLQTCRVQHGNLLGRFTKPRPGVNPIRRHYFSYHIIYQIYIRKSHRPIKISSPSASFLAISSSMPKLKKGPWK
jgi:hypothetical protein